LVVIRLAIVVRDVICKKYSDMHGGRLFKHSDRLLFVSLSAGVSFVSESAVESKVAALLLNDMRSRGLDVPRPATLMSCATSSFWKSLSSKGTGSGVVQELSMMQDGRPVMTPRRCSML
jgi:hypothetical protein